MAKKRKVKREPKPFEPARAEAFIELMRAGHGFDASLRAARLTEPRLFGWLQRSNRSGPAGEPYRGFRDAVIGYIAESFRASPIPLERRKRGGVV
jgi:hypothetical protein